MIKKLIIGVSLVPFLMLPAIAQVSARHRHHIVRCAVDMQQWFGRCRASLRHWLPPDAGNWQKGAETRVPATGDFPDNRGTLTKT